MALYALVFWRGPQDNLNGDDYPHQDFGGIFTSIELAKRCWYNYNDDEDFYAASIHILHPNIAVHADGILNTPCVAHWGEVPFNIR